jgi:predicted RNA-binding Zn ribbon-like protein
MTDDPSLRGKGRVLRCAPEGLCLDFVNTVAWRKSEAPEERLGSAFALLDWCVAAGTLEPDYGAALRARWEERPREAVAFYRRALALREAIYWIFRSRILSEAAPEEALQVLNETLETVPPRVRLAPAATTLGWRAGSVRPAPSDMLAPLAWSAADLMASPRADRVRQCADDKGCGWLFLDESRAGTRRWCSMGDCGNRAKARRHYLRRKHAEGAARH